MIETTYKAGDIITEGEWHWLILQIDYDNCRYNYMCLEDGEISFSTIHFVDSSRYLHVVA